MLKHLHSKGIKILWIIKISVYDSRVNNIGIKKDQDFDVTRC